MSTSGRRARIVEELESAGSLSVAELVERHGVSEMTIRRDLTELERQHLLQRFHGGASVDRRRSYEPPYFARETRQRDPKRSIARTAAGLVADGESLAIGFGTTALEVARCLNERSHLTVVTPNLRVAVEVGEVPSTRLLLSGGLLRQGEMSLIGPDAERCFHEHFVDTAIIGAAGVDAEHGVTDFRIEEVAVTRALVRGAKRVILVADATKLGVVVLSSVTAIDAVDVLVTDADTSDPRLSSIAARGIEVRTAASDEHRLAES